MSEVLSGSRIIKGTIAKDRLAPEVLADIAGGMTAAQVDAKLNEFKMLLFGGDVPAALDTFRELAEAISQDKTGLAALQTVVAGKATPADITTAVNAAVALLLGGASDDSNTLKKLEVMVKQAQQAAINAIADGAVTNAKLGADVKVGSLNAAANAFPVGVQAGLTSVEKFLVYLAQQLSAVQTSGGNQQSTASNHEQRLVTIEQALPNKASQADFNSLGQRVTTLEGKVGSSTGASSGGNGAFSGTFSGTVNGVTIRNLGDGSKYLADDGSYKTLVIPASLPAQAGNAGRALKTDGTNAYWADLGSLAVYWESAARSTTNSQTILEYINSLGGTSLELQFEVGTVAGDSTLSSRRAGRFKSADVQNLTYFRVTLIGATGNTEVYAGDPRTAFDFTLVAGNRYRFEVTVADGSKGSSIILYP